MGHPDTGLHMIPNDLRVATDIRILRPHLIILLIHSTTLTAKQSSLLVHTIIPDPEANITPDPHRPSMNLLAVRRVQKIR